MDGQQPTLFHNDEVERLSTVEAAKVAKVHPRTIQKWVTAGKIRRTPTGDIDPESLTNWLQYQRVALDVKDDPAVTPEAPWAPLGPVLKRLDAMGQEIRAVRQRVSRIEKEVSTAERMNRLLEREVEAARKREADLISLFKLQTAQTANLPPRTVKTGTKRERILEYLQQEGRPRRPYHVQQALSLEESPTRELSRLVERGEAIRIAPSQYLAVGVPMPEESPTPTLNVLERVFQAVNEAERPLRAAEIRDRIRMHRDISPELSKLVERGRISRKDGLYSSPAPRHGTANNAG